MAYIGRPSIVGNFVKLDAITAVNGQAAYTMQNNSVNFTDYSTVNQFLVSLNGTIQSPGSSFTVSGSTLTFASNLSTGDVIDFIVVFGNSLSAGTPTDATVSTAKIVDSAVTTAKINANAVTSAKLNNDIISGATELASEPADTDEFLVSDAGTLKRVDYSYIKPSSDFVFISTTTISSSVAQVDIDYDYSTYKQIFHFIEGIQGDADTNIYARFKVSGSIDTSSVYSSNTVKKYYGGFDSATYGGNNQSYMYVTDNVGGDTYESWSAQLRIMLGSGTGMPLMDLTTFYKSNAGNFDANFGACGVQNFYQIQGIRLYPSTGNFDTGKIHTYGVK